MSEKERNRHRKWRYDALPVLQSVVQRLEQHLTQSSPLDLSRRTRYRNCLGFFLVFRRKLILDNIEEPANDIEEPEHQDGIGERIRGRRRRAEDNAADAPRRRGE